MKKYNILILLVAVITFLCTSSISVFADPPDPPLVPTEHGNAGDVPVGAPIDGGVSILLILGAGYGVKKLYSLRDVKAE